jgi:hypothetical protein
MSETSPLREMILKLIFNNNTGSKPYKRELLLLNPSYLTDPDNVMLKKWQGEFSFMCEISPISEIISIFRQ